jgi:hypothetical protein
LSASDNRNKVHEEKGGTLNGALDESEARWWAKWRRKVKTDARRAVEEADALKGSGRRRKAGVNKREGTKQNGGLRKRRKTVAAEVKKEDNDNDTAMLADNEMDGEDDEWESDAAKESSDDDDDEWKALSLEEIKVDEENMQEDMRILIKVRFGSNRATKLFSSVLNSWMSSWRRSNSMISSNGIWTIQWPLQKSLRKCMRRNWVLVVNSSESSLLDQVLHPNLGEQDCHRTFH